MFKKDIDSQRLGEGEGIAHGFEHHYRKEKGIATKNRLINLGLKIWNAALDFGEGFITRKATKDSRTMRWGAGLANFADNAADNLEKQAERKEPLLPQNVLGGENDGMENKEKKEFS